MFKQFVCSALVAMSVIPVFQVAAIAWERCETYRGYDRHGRYSNKHCYEDHNETSIGEDLAVLGGLLILKVIVDEATKPREPKVEEHVAQQPYNEDSIPKWYNLPDGHGGYSRRYCILEDHDYNPHTEKEFFCEN